MIDTNVLISASKSPLGNPFRAFQKATALPNRAIVCHQNIKELRYIYNKKFPDKITEMEHFLTLALSVIEIVSTPLTKIDEEKKIRDVTDRPILRAAINAEADILITGDKDFIEAGLTKPKIMTPKEFLSL